MTKKKVKKNPNAESAKKEKIVIVKKDPRGKYVWAYPTHGMMDSHDPEYVKWWFSTKGIKFKVKEIGRSHDEL